MANAMNATNTSDERSLKGVQNTSCTVMIHFDPSTSSLPMDRLAEKLTRDRKDRWQTPIKRGRILIIPATLPSAIFLVLEFFETFIKVTVETRSDGINGLGKIVVSPCNCGDIFLDLENILYSLDLSFLEFRWCHGKSSLFIGNVLNDIPTEQYFQLEKLVTEMATLRDTINDLLCRTTAGNINDKTGFHGFLTDEEFLTELNELKFQRQNTAKEIGIFLGKIKSDFGASPITQNGIDEVPMNLGVEVRKNKKIHSLPMLLSLIANQLFLPDWSNLRQFISLYLPQRTFGNIQNGVEIFQELVKRDVINSEDIEFLRNGLYDIGRVDLVHLIDCVQQGDFSLLGNQNLIYQMDRHGNIRVNEKRFGVHDNVPLLPQLSRRDRSDPQGATSEEDTCGNLRSNQGGSGINDNVPRRILASSHVPSDPQVQGLTSEDELRMPSMNHQRYNGGNAELPSNNLDVPQRSRSPPEVPVENNESDDDSAEHPKVENPGIPCEHYNRECVCQFECCEEFWPCHRCHNAHSSCSNLTLRSKDTKKIKCKRCALVQEFPKEIPYCVGCNLKFAEYFCSHCKHLTGTGNQPFHCNKCGICRIHNDRSFHCDTCGVCLDVQLRNNHKCRPGSAHDQCCICFEDAFAGCKILPCSHKVHEDCAILMIENGITKCPVCREPFSRHDDSGEYS